MNKQRIMTYLFRIVIGLMVGTIAIMIFGATLRARRAPAKSQDDRSLKERAKREHRAVKAEGPDNAVRFNDLTELVNHSSSVIIGTPQRNASRLTPDGKSATIEYQVKVEFVYKGSLHEGDLVTVGLPGGMIKFDDGNSAEVRTPWFRKMLNNKTYALFLTTKGNERNQSFQTTGGQQGVFDIPTTSSSRVVKSHSALENDPIQKYHDMEVRTFLQQLRQAVSGKTAK